MSGEPDLEFWRTRRVLVTGGNGFLGQAVLDRLSTRQPGSVVAPTSADYDLRDRSAVTAMFADAVDAKESGADHMEVWGTGNASREFLFVDDAAEGIALAAERYDDGEPVNLGADREFPIRDLVEIIVKLVGFEGEVRWDTSKPDGQPRRGVDASRARERFGFVAGTPFDEGLRLTLDWYLSHREEAEARPV